MMMMVIIEVTAWVGVLVKKFYGVVMGINC
jgi:hypothetical protein